MCPKGGGKPEQSVLSRIIRGYLGEFIRQSEQEIVPVNIEHDRNPEAKKYWQERSASEFREAIVAGQVHSAAAYRKLRKDAQKVTSKKIGKSPVFHSLGEIIRSTLDVFKNEYTALNPDGKPAPSLYNDQTSVINLANKIEHLQQSR